LRARQNQDKTKTKLIKARNPILSGMFKTKTKTNPELLNDCVLVWENKKGSNFEKTLELFRNYSGYGDFFTISSWVKHAEAINTILSLYYGDEGYLKKYPNSLYCDVGLLLFQISKIPNIENDQPRELKAIFVIISHYTKIDFESFYPASPLHDFFSKNEEFICKNAMDCETWADMFSKDSKRFLSLDKYGFISTLNQSPSILEIFLTSNLMPSKDLIVSMIKNSSQPIFFSFYDNYSQLI
jgi:hypothetical protein